MARSATVSSDAAPSNPDPISNGSEVGQRLDRHVERARAAATEFRMLDQASVDRIVWAMTVAGLENAIDLAELAMEETHFGVFEDKVVKNYIATEFLYDYLKDKRSVGVIDEDPERGIVVGGGADRGGPGADCRSPTPPRPRCSSRSWRPRRVTRSIFRPSARAVRCAERAVEILQEAGETSGPAAARAPGDPRPDARRLAVPVPPPRRRPDLDHRRPQGGRRRKRGPASPASQRRPRERARLSPRAAPTSAWQSSTCSSRRRSTPR